MKLTYLIEDRVIFEPDAFRLWPIDDPQAGVTLYAPVSQCLSLLLQHPLEVVSQELFFEEVWRKNGLYVNANTLYQNMALLRKALRSLGIKKDIIKTVPRQGMKFTGSSRILPDKPSESDPDGIEIAEPAQAVLAAEDKNTENGIIPSATEKKSRLGARVYIPFVIIILAMISILQLMGTEGWGTNTNDLGHYFVTGQAGQCVLHSSSSDKEQSFHYLSELTRITGMRCTNNESVWMTFNSSNGIVSAVKCDTQLRDSEAECAVWVYRESQYE
ncbi:winged helix-turn-helix domain-containing protein [Enterobacter asburiae]|uniref:winged helix-turn-helix domain-containing protein n=1 Tax=Enterobacter asburiae TaxID=61645 RepID=UPI00200306B5|nr:winged helix-turn-helix domain-containing protein [Enterobacter asburiae]MCK7229998.1 winged helix-turn-helix domain-containing protein [Enterobacter asburiae]